jgi:ATP-dependent protease ClpP protease subunit
MATMLNKNTQKTIYINYFGGISEKTVNKLMNLCNQILSKLEPDVLYFPISSQGGSVNAGIMLYSYLKSLPVKIVTHNVSSVASIANVFFVAGKERYANEHSVFLIHGSSIMLPHSPLSQAQLQEVLSSMKADNDRILQILCDETKLTKNNVRGFFNIGQSLNTKKATKSQLINEVRLFQLPANSIVINADTTEN